MIWNPLHLEIKCEASLGSLRVQKPFEIPLPRVAHSGSLGTTTMTSRTDSHLRARKLTRLARVAKLNLVSNYEFHQVFNSVLDIIDKSVFIDLFHLFLLDILLV